MATLYLRTFGGLSLEREGTPLPSLEAQRKALALVAVLAAEQGGVPRERLMALLWPESDEARARGALKQMVYSLRRQLGAPGIVTGTAELRLDPASIESDVAAFRAALAAGDDAAAIRLHAGPFLDGVHIDDADEFERWSDETRRDLARRHGDALARCAARAAADLRWTDAAEGWRRLEAVEPTSTRATLGLMEGLVALGDAPAALRHGQ